MGKRSATLRVLLFTANKGEALMHFTVDIKSHKTIINV